MQNKTKMINISIAALLICAVFTVLRTMLLLFSFNFETSLFQSKLAATSLYAVFLVFILLIFFLQKKSVAVSGDITKENVLIKILIFAKAILFMSLFVAVCNNYKEEAANLFNPLSAVSKVSYYIAIPATFLSVIYYLLRLLSKNKTSVLNLLFALFPVLSITSLVTKYFGAVSANASSLSHFPSVLALIILALFILTEGRAFSEKNGTVYFCFLTVCFSTLAFSVIPDLVCIAGGLMTPVFEDAVYLIMKFVFAAYAFCKAIILIKNTQE